MYVCLLQVSKRFRSLTCTGVCKPSSWNSETLTRRMRRRYVSTRRKFYWHWHSLFLYEYRTVPSHLMYSDSFALHDVTRLNTAGRFSVSHDVRCIEMYITLVSPRTDMDMSTVFYSLDRNCVQGRHWLYLHTCLSVVIKIWFKNIILSLLFLISNTYISFSWIILIWKWEIVM